MIDLTQDIHSLSDFKRQTAKFRTRMKKTGNPVILTINGKAEMIVQDAASYQRLLERAEHAEMAEFLRESRADIENGRTEPALEALERGGTLALAGIYSTDIPALNYERHLFHEKTLRSVTANTRQDGEELLRIAAEVPLRPHTTQFPLQDANRALRQLKHDAIQGAGVLVTGVLVTD